MTLHFSIVNDESVSADILNDDLQLVSNWSYQWKMVFNPDAAKQTQEVTLFAKNYQDQSPSCLF